MGWVAINSGISRCALCITMWHSLCRLHDQIWNIPGIPFNFRSFARLFSMLWVRELPKDSSAGVISRNATQHNSWYYQKQLYHVQRKLAGIQVGPYKLPLNYKRGMFCCEQDQIQHNMTASGNCRLYGPPPCGPHRSLAHPYARWSEIGSGSGQCPMGCRNTSDGMWCSPEFSNLFAIHYQL